MLEKDCNGNPISTFPPSYAFQMIFTELAPWLIQAISRNVHNKNRALKQLCVPCYTFCNASLQEVKAGRANVIIQPNNSTTSAHTLPLGQSTQSLKCQWLFAMSKQLKL